MLPWSASYVVGSFLAPALARRIQPAFVMAGGLVLATIGFFALPRVAGLGVEAVIIASTAYSLGLSPVFTLGIDAIIAAAPPERPGAAAALSETGSELGGELGIAILGSVATAVYRGYLRHAGLLDIPPEARKVALDTLGLPPRRQHNWVPMVPDRRFWLSRSSRSHTPCRSRSPSALPHRPDCRSSRRSPFAAQEMRRRESDAKGTRGKRVSCGV